MSNLYPTPRSPLKSFTVAGNDTFFFYRVYCNSNIDRLQTNFLTYLLSNRTSQLYDSSFLILNFDPYFNGMVDLPKMGTKSTVNL